MRTPETNATLSEDNHIPDWIDVKGAGVIGCQRTARYAMVTAGIDADPRKRGAVRFVDVFLTREQAIELRAKLDVVIARDERVGGEG